MENLTNVQNLSKYKTDLIQFTLYNKKLFMRRPELNFNNLIINKSLCGLKLVLNGRLKGAKRARALQLIKGKIKAQTFTFPIQAKHKPIQTKWGKMGLNLILGINSC